VHHHVYDGDQPSPHRNAWQEAMAEMEAAITQAARTAMRRPDRDDGPRTTPIRTGSGRHGEELTPWHYPR
jgi:hypothetical protein